MRVTLFPQEWCIFLLGSLRIKKLPEKNQFGLGRHIPADVALEVRRRSKFGCVNCRVVVYQYHHILPEFHEAKSHDPDAICLLCGGCHDRATRGRLSKQTIQAKYEEVQACDDIKRPFEDFDLRTNQITVKLGTATFEQANCLININGTDLLAINPPKDGAIFPSLSGTFCDRSGKEIFRITENVWEGPNDAWDIKVVGQTLEIKTEQNRTALLIEVQPPDIVVVKWLDMFIDNCHICCDETRLLVGHIGRDGASSYIGLGNFSCRGATTGICVDARGEQPPKLNGLRMAGGEGIILPGTGIKIAVGAGSMHIAELQLWQE